MFPLCSFGGHLGRGSNANKKMLKMAQKCYNVKLIVGAQGSSKSITANSYDAWFSRYRTICERSMMHLFVYGVKFSNCSDLNENGLKLLHVLPETNSIITRSHTKISLPYSNVGIYYLDSRGQRSAFEYSHSTARGELPLLQRF